MFAQVGYLGCVEYMIYGLR